MRVATRRRAWTRAWRRSRRAASARAVRSATPTRYRPSTTRSGRSTPQELIISTHPPGRSRTGSSEMSSTRRFVATTCRSRTSSPADDSPAALLAGDGRDVRGDSRDLLVAQLPRERGHRALTVRDAHLHERCVRLRLVEVRARRCRSSRRRRACGSRTAGAGEDGLAAAGCRRPCRRAVSTGSEPGRAVGAAGRTPVPATAADVRGDVVCVLADDDGLRHPGCAGRRSSTIG